VNLKRIHTWFAIIAASIAGGMAGIATAINATAAINAQRRFLNRVKSR
jgi:hypothetical protein